MVPGPGASPQIILAFDFGTRRLGVASGDTLTRTSRGLVTLDRTKGIPWAAIDRIAADYPPARILVGIPYNMDGTPTALTAASRDFARELKQRYRVAVALIDERLSSREAEAQLRAARAAGLKRRRTKHEDVDKVAASVILARWFDDPAAAEEV